MPDAKDPSFARFVAVCAVVTTLAGGMVGYIQSTASRSADVAGTEGARLSVRANAERERQLHIAYAVYDRYALWQQERVRLARLVEQQLGLPGQGTAPAELDRMVDTREQVADEVRRSVRALAKERGLPDLVREHRFSPLGDPYFPQRFLATAERRGIELSALQDAAEEEAAAWGADQASYLAILTMFAVALYLFGFALTPHAQLPRVFVGAALVLLVAGSVWAGVTRTTVPTRAPKAAAAEFAAGHVAVNTAFTQRDSTEAVEHFTRAIDLRPSFARAYVERSAAAFRAGSPQRFGALSLSEPDARRQAIDDLVKARELGSYSPADLTALGFYWSVEGVMRRDEELLQRSEAVSREAISVAEQRGEDTSPIPHFNLGVTLLAAERIDEAETAYQSGIELVPDDIFAKSDVVAGALTDLDLVEQRGTHRAAAEARRLKGIVMAGAFDADFADRPSAKPLDVSVDAGPGGLRLRKGVGYSRLCTRALVAVWYQTARPDLGWYVAPASIVNDFRQCIPGLRYSAAESFIGSSYPRRCLADGKYRLELYAGPNVVARRSVTVDYGSERALEALDLGIAMCRPDGWKLWPGAQPGLSAGLVSADGEKGTLALRLTERVAVPDRPRVLETVLRRYAGVIGATVTAPGSDAGLGFMDIPTPATLRYLASDKEVLAGIGEDADGSVVIGIVFGPRRWFATPTPQGLFDAMALAYQPVG